MIFFWILEKEKPSILFFLKISESKHLWFLYFETILNKKSFNELVFFLKASNELSHDFHEIIGKEQVVLQSHILEMSFYDWSLLTILIFYMYPKYVCILYFFPFFVIAQCWRFCYLLHVCGISHQVHFLALYHKAM